MSLNKFFRKTAAGFMAVAAAAAVCLAASPVTTNELGTGTDEVLNWSITYVNEKVSELNVTPTSGVLNMKNMTTPAGAAKIAGNLGNVVVKCNYEWWDVEFTTKFGGRLVKQDGGTPEIPCTPEMIGGIEVPCTNTPAVPGALTPLMTTKAAPDTVKLGLSISVNDRSATGWNTNTLFADDVDADSLLNSGEMMAADGTPATSGVPISFAVELSDQTTSVTSTAYHQFNSVSDWDDLDGSSGTIKTKGFPAGTYKDYGVRFSISAWITNTDPIDGNAIGDYSETLTFTLVAAY